MAANADLKHRVAASRCGFAGWLRRITYMVYIVNTTVVERAVAALSG